MSPKPDRGDKQQQLASTEEAIVLPYFRGNGEDGVYFAWSRDGLKFESLNDGKVMFPAPDWGDESLTRDPSIVYRNGVFHMVWTTSWRSRTFGYARSTDLRNWTAACGEHMAGDCGNCNGAAKRGHRSWRRRGL